MASAARVAALEAQLARTSSSAAASAAKAEATVEVVKEAATAARKKAKLAGQSLAHARGCVKVLEAKPRAPSSLGATTCTEEEVEVLDREKLELPLLEAIQQCAREATAPSEFICLTPPPPPPPPRHMYLIGPWRSGFSRVSNF